MSFAALPSLDELRRRSNDPNIIAAYRYSGSALSRRVRVAADELGSLGFVAIHVNNKIKHGGVFVDDPEIIRRYYDYGGDWDVEHTESRVYVVPKLGSNQTGQRQMKLPPTILDATGEFAHKLVSNTHQLCRSAKEVVAMSIMMNRIGLLW
jgi:hypothetical protein